MRSTFIINIALVFLGPFCCQSQASESTGESGIRKIYLNETDSEKFLEKLVVYYGSIIKDSNVKLIENYPVGSPEALQLMTISAKANTVTISFEKILGTNGTSEALIIEEEMEKLIPDLTIKPQENKFDIILYFSGENCFQKNFERRKRALLRSNRITIGFGGGFNAVYRFLSSDNSSSSLEQQILDRNNNEFATFKPTFNISLGLSTGSHRYSLGIGGLAIGYQFKENAFVDNQSGLYHASEAIESQKNWLCNLSLNYQYLSFSKTVAPYFMLGFDNSFFLGQIKNDMLGTRPNRYFGTSITSSLGLSYKLKNERVIWYMAPSGLVYFNSGDLDEIQARFYSIGVQLGVVFNMVKPLKSAKCG